MPIASPSMTFQGALEFVESMPDHQQDDFIGLLRRRRLERRREALAQSVIQAREELAQGEIRWGSVEDLMGEVSE